MAWLVGTAAQHRCCYRYAHLIAAVAVGLCDASRVRSGTSAGAENAAIIVVGRSFLVI
jgi:hypothetical protein